MGSCLSKKTPSSPPNAATASQSVDPHKSCTGSIGHNNIKMQKKKFSLSPTEEEEEQQQRQKQGEEVNFRKEVEQESLVKKEIFVIKHRKSQDRDKRSPPPPHSLPPPNTNPPLLANKNDVPTAREPAAAAAGVAATSAAEMVVNANGTVRTSSCTKEEVDAILIQCGILSRSNSTGAGKAAASSSSGRKCSGSKRRSFDLDHNGADAADVQCKDDEDNQEAVAEERQHRQRHHHRRQSPSSSSQGRRRTPSRERDQNSTSSGRRLSRSPARKRSETTTPNAADNKPRPAKMLSVPAASLSMDKSNNSVETQTQTASAIKRISVKRCSSPVSVHVGEAASAAAAAAVGSRTAASPRSRSPARANAAKGCNDNNQQQQQPSLSRNSSRKAEQSPYRRNPLTEIDQNSMPYSQTAANKATCVNNSNSRGAQPKTKVIDGQVAVNESVRVLDQKPNIEVNIKNFARGTNCQGCNLGQPDNKDPEEQQQNVEKANGQTRLTSNVVTATVIPSGVDSLNPQALTRSRSARRSRDLDLNPETLLNPTSSYTALLLEDIQNFHQKNNNPSFSVPPCVTKACSILEAVADLNSTTSSNISSICSNDRKSHLPAANLAGKKTSEAREPFLESEILTRDDLTEPSFHKYVTVRRGGTLYGGDMDGQESSGSNSFVDGSQQHWGLSASSWEPNSADSTDRWTSRSNTREVDDDKSPLGFQKHTLSEPGHDMEEARKKGFSGQRNGIGRGRPGTARNLHATPVIAATAST